MPTTRTGVLVNLTAIIAVLVTRRLMLVSICGPAAITHGTTAPVLIRTALSASATSSGKLSTTFAFTDDIANDDIKLTFVVFSTV